ncbi:MAG TPA: peptidoglycan DD-metalloendopeptidase family protein [Gammaproteobacteria bacterium]|nr:peptidoglycan DD-metalloendopeptidase family protein [Gammaproteobacteria bacterium]
MRAHAPLVAGLCLALSACGGAALRWEPETYTVRAGDSLYAIAWRYRLDYRDLSRWNGIDNPDLIYPGQRLRLSGPARSATGRAPAAPRSAPRSARADAPPTAPRSAATPPAAQTAPRSPPPGWHWPADGELVAGFGNGGGAGKGIDIGGRAGDTVRAAADGRVVYSGSGLIGYGQLIIIKHNNTYLSAYGHNRALLVSEGDAVERGQRIAEMGMGPEKKPVLHFEIRLNGKPVDPLQHLPAR